MSINIHTYIYIYICIYIYKSLFYSTFFWCYISMLSYMHIYIYMCNYITIYIYTHIFRYSIYIYTGRERERETGSSVGEGARDSSTFILKASVHAAPWQANESLRRRLSKLSQDEEEEEPTPSPAARKPKSSPKKPRSPAKPKASPVKPRSPKKASPKKARSPKKASPKKAKGLPSGNRAVAAPAAVDLDDDDDATVPRSGDESTSTSTRGGKISKKDNMDAATKAFRAVNS